MPQQDVMAEIDHRQPWGTYQPQGWRRASLAVAHAIHPHWPAAERVAKVFRHPIKYAGQPCYDVTIWGYRLRLTPHGNRSEARLLYAPQLFDADERAFLARHAKPGGTFVDIGANAGAYTFWASHCMRAQGRILAFEPDPEMRARLAFNIATNGLNNVQVQPVALSDHAGSAVLHVNRRQRGQNTLEAARAAGGTDDRVAHTVEVDTLLNRLQQQDVRHVDALKIDIEGHEEPVLRHFFDHAPRSLWPRAILAEYTHDTHDAVQTLLASAGYRVALETALNRGLLLDAPEART